MGCGSIKKQTSSQELEPKATYFEDRDDQEPEITKELTIPNCPIKITIQHLNLVPADFPNKPLFTVKEEQSYLEESGPPSKQSYLEESGLPSSDMILSERLNSRKIRLPPLK